MGLQVLHLGRRRKKTYDKESDFDMVCINKDIINEFTAALGDGIQVIRETNRAPRMMG